jgi:hypothetical protein
LSKGGLQLSIKFLVTIILAMTMLAAGILILRQFIDVTTDTQAQIDQRTQQRLSELLNAGEQIAIPFSRQSIRRGESYVFGVGILNIEEANTFRVNVDLSSAYHKDNTPFTNQEIINHQLRATAQKPPLWFLYDNLDQSLSKNQRKIINVLVSVPKNAPSGEYIYNVIVVRPSPPGGALAQYDKTRKIHITVP